MPISLCTASHDTAFLEETYQSILRQVGVDWEWVVCLQHDTPVPGFLLEADGRVRVVGADADAAGNLGAMKAKAFLHAKGRLLVDLDHDDLLEPGCLKALDRAAPHGAEEVFLYGDSAGFHPDKTSPVLSGPGWRRYRRSFGGADLNFHRPPEPGPASLADHLTVPHQPRAWSRAAYERLGGFDPKVLFAAEHDLICRTYAEGVPMVHAAEARSVYRVRGDGRGAMALRQKDFDSWASRNRWRHLRKMVARWCRDRKLPTLVVTARKATDPGAFEWHDAQRINIRQLEMKLRERLESGIQWINYGAIVMADCLHVLPQGEAPHRLGQIVHRLLAPGGWLLTDTLSCEGRGKGDPIGLSLWNEYTWQMLAAEVGLAETDTRSYHPSADHKAWDLLFVRADLYKPEGGDERHEKPADDAGREPTQPGPP